MSKKVLITGYPKSGNTWLGYMVSYILGAKYIDLESPDAKVTLQKEILELVDGSVSHKTNYQEVCKTHDRYHFSQESKNFDLDSFDKVLLIIRDPRDVAVSYFFYKFYNIPVALNKPQRIISNRSWFIRKFCWSKNVSTTARDWAYHTISWRTFEGKYLIKYEDLVLDCQGELKKICNYLDIECDDAIIQDAVNLFSFNKLSGGRKSGEEYKTAFFRKGIVGDYKNHFNFIDNMLLKRHAGQEMNSLGYE